MSHIPQTTENGFIALLSILIISVTLLASTLSLAQLGIANRFFMLTLEQKTMSERYADACVHIGRVTIYNNPHLSMGTAKMYAVGDGICTIHSIAQSGTENILHVSASEENAVTYYEVVIDNTNGAFISWDEVLAF